MTWSDDFLGDRDPKTWSGSEGLPASVVAQAVYVQSADAGLEVAVASSRSRPTAETMRKAWKARQGGRAAPVLLVVGYPVGNDTRLAICGPAGVDPPVHFDLESPRVERLAETALNEPSRHAAQRCLARLLPEIESPLPGVVNIGLLATQELRLGVPARSDWAAATAEVQSSLKLRGRPLVQSLGFTVAQLSSDAVVLREGQAGRAVAIFLDEGDTFDAPSARFDGVSAVSRALALADRERLPWVVITRSSEIRLYAARADTGVGRKGRAETFIELNLALLPDELAGYLGLLFSARALAEGGTFDQILDRSADFAADLATRLRERVYREAVPALASAIAKRMGQNPTEADLDDAYEQTLTILFRLLFVAYGEDKELLPYRTNSRYEDHSLNLDEGAEDLWEDVVQLWRAVDKGNTGWGVPPYDGGLFSSEVAANPAGAALLNLRLTDVEFGTALVALLLDKSEGEAVGPVDFRSLSVREFGTIYEGLLESELSVATTDLAEQSDGALVPAGPTSDVAVARGQVYLHNRSGSRKATGSYFTKPFAVEHLLDYALEPALDDHVARLEELIGAGDEAAAAGAFFDFRCVDMAMGSGHFLVAAVDRIEARLGAFLALNPIPLVTAELDTLREAALFALGDLAVGMELETASLLRRQVARRCIYGVDRNRIAVELARLAIWIHTFVPGLPLSFLDHSLVEGDSLSGVATLDEALQVLARDAPTAPSMFGGQIMGFLERASTALRRLATVSEATVAEVEIVRAAHSEALEQVAPARALFDLITAHRSTGVALPEGIAEDHIIQEASAMEVTAAIAVMRPLHFPVAFPEVFLRERPGFDCILGNPPWEEATVEELGFWAVRFPGLKGLSSSEQKTEILSLKTSRPDLVSEYEGALVEAEAMRRVLIAGPFPGMGTGDPDLYKAFCWRFWDTCRVGGAIGVVLPRSALAAKGSAPWREAVLDGGTFTDTTMVLNTGGWVFDDAEHRYTIGFIAIRKGQEFTGEVSTRGPFSSFDRYRAGMAMPAAVFPSEEFRSWSEGASFPLLPSPEIARVFQKLRAHPRLDAPHTGWRARPVTEFHATNDKRFLDFSDEAPAGAWPVYKGASFNIWDNDTGVYYAWAEPDVVRAELQRRRISGHRNRRSAYSECPSDWVLDAATLPCLHPRIAFRDVARATDTRTVIAALIPPQTIITNQAPYLVWPLGEQEAEAFLLGVLCSMPLDWYARRVVETHLNFHVFNSMPVPDPSVDHPARRRVVEISGRLAAVDDRFSEWATEVGVPVASVEDAQRDELFAELDAAVATLYGLDADDLRVIYGTFHERGNYDERCARAIAHLEGIA
jgi:hypothetical protein